LQLQEKIDISPNNKEEQKALLKELRLQKKELQLEKKEINARMKDIRTTARQKYATAPYTVTGMLGQTAAQRRALRYNKEAALSPHESARDGIERQISLVEREILWAERFAEGAVKEAV